MTDGTARGSGGVPEPLPFPNSYWVIPGKLLAGEHPAGPSREDTQKRLEKLLAVGITCIVDLTMPDEMDPYDTELPMSVDYVRKPIKDHSIPARREHMIDIQECLDYAMRSGQKTYVHCRAGIGRTGTVIGCFLVEQGLSPPDALDALNRAWQQSQRASSWPQVPETDDQNKFVLSWTPQVATTLTRRVAPGTDDSAANGRAPFVTPEDAVPKARGKKSPAPQLADDPLLEPETLNAARNLRDRFLGALVGLAVGDALAAATQYKKAGTFTPVGDLLGGGPFDVPRAAWTDDTSMALCLGESLVETGGFNPRDQVARYTRWQQEGYLSATGQCVGITASTAKALAMAKWRRQLYSGSHDPNQLDPEVLSRVAPVVMFFFATPTDAVANAGDSDRTTCQSPGAVESCRFFGAVLHGALAGKPKPAVLSPPPDLFDTSNLRTDVIDLARHALELGAVGTPVPGNVLEALEVALWAFRTTDNFRDGALRAANLGGNSDAATAAYGQLAGAHYGVGAIPGTWRNSLIGKESIELLADRLLAHAVVALGGAE
jgi:ADP-ribosylglycohydrolase/protein-tyrosine phosphatase